MVRIRHTAADRGPELYETPPEATHALLAHEMLPQRLWEPAAGRGAIVRVLRAAGHTVLSTDLHDHPGAEPWDVDQTGLHFLKPLKGIPEIGAIVTNPPFSLAQEFVDRSLQYAPMCCMLLRLVFLESESRHDWFKRVGLRRVHVFSNRLPFMHRDGWSGPRSTSTTAFAWFIFNRDWKGEATLNWIRWRPVADSN
jgi:hypothetical protein